jgi:hypothetical protein
MPLCSCCQNKYAKLLSKEDIKKCVQKMLDERFPTKAFFVCVFINLMLGALAIAFGISLIIVKGKNYKIGVGYLKILNIISFYSI